MLKASDVKWLVPHKKPEPTYFPAVEGFNQCIDETSSKEFYLDRENLAKIIYSKVHNEWGIGPKWEYAELDKKEYYFLISDSIIQSFNAGHLLRVKG